MILSNETLSILSNFSTINKTIQLTPGKSIKVKNIKGSVYAKADIVEDFPRKAAIFDTPQLLDVISIFEQPEIDFEDYNLKISKGDRKIKYFYASEISVAKVLPPEEEPEIFKTPPTVTCTLTGVHRKNLLDAVSALKVKGVSLQGLNGDLLLRVYDDKQGIENSNSYSEKIGSCAEDFRFNFLAELFNVLPGDYTCGVCFGTKPFIKLSRERLVYYIAGQL